MSIPPTVILSPWLGVPPQAWTVRYAISFAAKNICAGWPPRRRPAGGGVKTVPNLTVQGLPLVKPPYGRITAIDLNKKANLVWAGFAHGETPDNHQGTIPGAPGAMNIPRTGRNGRHWHALVTQDSGGCGRSRFRHAARDGPPGGAIACAPMTKADGAGARGPVVHARRGQTGSPDDLHAGAASSTFVLAIKRGQGFWRRVDRVPGHRHKRARLDVLHNRAMGLACDLRILRMQRRKLLLWAIFGGRPSAPGPPFRKLRPVRRLRPSRISPARGRHGNSSLADTASRRGRAR